MGRMQRTCRYCLYCSSGCVEKKPRRKRWRGYCLEREEEVRLYGRTCKELVVRRPLSGSPVLLQ